MEDKGTGITRKLGIAATVVTLVGGSLALWKEMKPEEELPDLSSLWRISLRVDSSDPAKWIGHTWVFDVNVTPDADGYKGVGEQVFYDTLATRNINRFELDPFQVKDGRIVAGFKVNISRETSGMLDLKFDAEHPDRLSGDFFWDAANKRGKATVEVMRN